MRAELLDHKEKVVTAEKLRRYDRANEIMNEMRRCKTVTQTERALRLSRDTAATPINFHLKSKFIIPNLYSRLIEIAKKRRLMKIFIWMIIRQ